METKIPDDDEEDGVVFELGHDEDESRGGYVLFEAATLGKTLFGPDWGGPFRLGLGMRNTNDRLTRTAKLLAAGWPASRAALVMGLNYLTARKLKRALELLADTQFMCPCGKPISHPGMCPARQRMFPPRREFFDSLEVKPRWLANRLDRERRRAEAQKKLTQELALAAFLHWLDTREAIPRGMLRRGVRNHIHSHVLRQKEEAVRNAAQNIEAALPKLGEPPIRMMDIWHRCEAPRPSFGELRRIIRERAAAGEFARVGASNKAPFVAVARG